MKAKTINDEDILELRLSSLPTRPTAPKSNGGMGYGANEMKAAFDRLPLYIIDRFNDLIGDILALGDDSLSGAIMTGIKDGHTLNRLFTDVTSGDMASYLTVLGKSLAVQISEMSTEIAELKDVLTKLINAEKEDVCRE